MLTSIFELFNALQGEPFLVLLVMAVFICCELTFRHAKRTGLDTNIMVNGVLWIIGIGFMISHWFMMIFYHPEIIVKDPFTLIYFWSGISFFGGFFGAIMVGLAYFNIKDVHPVPYLESILFGAAPALIIGRLGCAITFDHPGTTTDFFLGMVDRYGVIRHNVGFYEMLVMIFLTAVLYGTRNLRPFEGFHAALFMFLYSPIRFFLDSLRVADKQYWGTTPGQYFAIAMLVLAVILIIRGMKTRLRDSPIDVCIEY